MWLVEEEQHHKDLKYKNVESYGANVPEVNLKALSLFNVF